LDSIVTEKAQNHRSGEDAHPALSRRLFALAALYLAAGALGYGIGVKGFRPAQPVQASASLTRVGFALRAESPHGTPEDWKQLRNDVDIVRGSWKPDDRDVFDLVVAVRGLRNGGSADYAEAERLCRALAWPRCDRDALERLKQRSRP
jgi:hypothetical protein